MNLVSHEFRVIGGLGRLAASSHVVHVRFVANTILRQYPDQFRKSGTQNPGLQNGISLRRLKSQHAPVDIYHIHLELRNHIDHLGVSPQCASLRPFITDVTVCTTGDKSGGLHEVIMKSDKLISQEVATASPTGLVTVKVLPRRAEGTRKTAPQKHRDFANVLLNHSHSMSKPVGRCHIVFFR